MKKTYIKLITFLFAFGLALNANAQENYCVSGCNNNTYIYSDDPNTIEYDNMVSTFHSTLAKEADGRVMAWGEGIAYDGSNHLTPHEINSTNYPNLTGQILKFTGGSWFQFTILSGEPDYSGQQFAVLTTTGLFIWGNPGFLVSEDIKNDIEFDRVTIGGQSTGLPAGVNPTDVKMMFGSFGTLAITTCSGEAYVLSFDGNKNGDGSVQGTSTNDSVWHRVMTGPSTPLENVVAVRGDRSALMALTSTGKVYTWGERVILNDGTTNVYSKDYATEMVLPKDDNENTITPKMIGMTGGMLYDEADTQSQSSNNPKLNDKIIPTEDRSVSYYLLDTDGHLWMMGHNYHHELSQLQRNIGYSDWVEPTIMLDGIETIIYGYKWISPQEHDGSNYNQGINVLSDDGILVAWGMNTGLMLGMDDNNNTSVYHQYFNTTNQSYSTALVNAYHTSHPFTIMPGATPNTTDPGELAEEDSIMAVETGGHTSIIIKQCSNKFGYVGHKINGSMADGVEDGGNIHFYNFDDTSIINLCGTPISPSVIEEMGVCGNTVDLADALLSETPSGFELVWYTTPNRASGTKVNDPEAVVEGIYYAFYEPQNEGDCPSLSGSKVTVTGCCFINPETDGTKLSTEVGISTLGRDAFDRAQNSWPQVRKGAWVALESNTKAFIPTRATTLEIVEIESPVKGMMVYDTDEKCLKINVDGTIEGWYCFDEPACEEGL